ncbi:MAG: hypothetical protein LBI02_06090 [Opitutaceae bacterium]|jgi:hypothetical protein|nr:hypothetical protein [Opitutaceae bacterium]
MGITSFAEKTELANKSILSPASAVTLGKKEKKEKERGRIKKKEKEPRTQFEPLRRGGRAGWAHPSFTGIFAL